MVKNKVLVTGGAGFVGSSVAIGIKNNYPNTDVACLDNLSRRGSEYNLERLKKNEISFVHGDIRNREDLMLENEKISLIIDCSAKTSVLGGYKSPHQVTRTNLFGSINCFELARKHSADIIFISTSRVYPVGKLRKLNIYEAETRFKLGHQEMHGASKRGVSEEFSVRGSRSMYGATKYASEVMLREYSSNFDINTIIDRCGVISGPWQMGKPDQGIFSYWLLSHYFEKPLQYIGFKGSGKQVRDVIHIDDLVELLQIQYDNAGSLSGEVFNVGGGRDKSMSLLETTKVCQRITGNKVKVEPVYEERPKDIPIYITDNSKIKEKTGWEPSRDPQKVFSDIYEWIEKNRNLHGVFK